jgi:hypothetical protein
MSAQEAVLQAFAAAGPAVRPAAPAVTASATHVAPAPPVVVTAAVPDDGAEHVERLSVSTDAYPEPRPLPDPAAGELVRPVRSHAAVPLTMSVALMMDAAQRRDPARVPVTVESRRPPLAARDQPSTLSCARANRDQIRVSIDGYIDATVTLGDHYPEPPVMPPPSIGAERPYPIADDAIYRDGWMFHGPG